MSTVHISKEQIAELEKVTFPGNIHVVDSMAKVKSAVTFLNKCDRLGFDTETRPSFKRGVTYKVALMQISTLTDCFLFRLNIVGMPDILKEFLENENITKIGISLKDDFGVLGKVTDANPHGFIDLQHLVPEYGIGDAGLQKIYAIIFGERISKNQRLTNWEAGELSLGQQVYAAIDAWACLKIYNHLEANGFIPTESKYYCDEDE
ncbi:MAG: 3'-5' exonuclease [Muribaculaceae bacterium]